MTPLELDVNEARPIGPDLNVRLSGEAAGFVAAQVAAGRHNDAEAVVAEALRLLEDEGEAEPWKEARYEQRIQAGLDDLEAGRYETLAP